MYETNANCGVGNTVSILEGEGIQKVDQDWLTKRYELLRVLGRGGMGVVLEAVDLKLQRKVAIKLGCATINTARQEMEVRTMAKLNIEGIVSVYDFERLSDGRVAIVMQLIDGTDLSTHINRDGGKIGIDVAKKWMLNVCTAMHGVERYGIVHRDLKPSNILINRQNQAVVTDFGLARNALSEQLTQAGQFLGTPAYTSPEQIENAHAVDVRADIYSFGATFFHVLVGSAPFKADSLYQLLLQHKTEPLSPPMSRRKDIPIALNNCIERCMAKNPVDRFSSFEDVAVAISTSDVDPWAFKDNEALNAFEMVYRLHRSRLLSQGSNKLEQEVVFDFPNGRRLTIMFGCLQEVEADVLVSSDDSYLTMGGGVSRALMHAAGKGYYEAARALAPARIGRVVVTPGYGLKAQYVFHGITIGDREDEYPNRDVIAELVDSCFYHAETFDVESIAFPLLGTGAGGLQKEISLDTMFRIIARRLLGTATAVKHVKILLLRSI